MTLTPRAGSSEASVVSPAQLPTVPVQKVMADHNESEELGALKAMIEAPGSTGLASARRKSPRIEPSIACSGKDTANETLPATIDKSLANSGAPAASTNAAGSSSSNGKRDAEAAASPDAPGGKRSSFSFKGKGGWNLVRTVVADPGAAAAAAAGRFIYTIDELCVIESRSYREAKQWEASAKAVPVDFSRVLGETIRKVGSTKAGLRDFLQNWDRDDKGLKKLDFRRHVRSSHE